MVEKCCSDSERGIKYHESPQSQLRQGSFISTGAPGWLYEKRGFSEGTGMGTPLVSFSNAFFILWALQSWHYPFHLYVSDTLKNSIPIICVGFSHSKIYFFAFNAKRFD